MDFESHLFIYSSFISCLR